MGATHTLHHHHISTLHCGFSVGCGCRTLCVYAPQEQGLGFPIKLELSETRGHLPPLDHTPSSSQHRKRAPLTYIGTPHFSWLFPSTFSPLLVGEYIAEPTLGPPTNLPSLPPARLTPLQAVVILGPSPPVPREKQPVSLHLKYLCSYLWCPGLG